MTAAKLRLATDEDLEVLVRLRVAFIADVRQVGADSFADRFVEATRAFFVDTMARDRIRSWIAAVDGVDVGIVSVLVEDMAPLPERLPAREGYVINMYVEPRARRRGIAKQLMDEAVAAADDLGLRGFFLHATEEGRPLYAATGFVDDPRIMKLRTDT